MHRNGLGVNCTPQRARSGSRRYTPRAVPVNMYDQSRLSRASYTPAAVQPFSLEPTRTTKMVKTNSERKRGCRDKTANGSAAADWSRWPAGTSSALVGLEFIIDYYGWAWPVENDRSLHGARIAMNAWCAREDGDQFRVGKSKRKPALLKGTRISHTASWPGTPGP